MIWECWIGGPRESGRQPSGKSARWTVQAERRSGHEVSSSGELWKCRRCGNGGNPTTGFPPFPQRLGNLAKAARFPHSHSSYGLCSGLSQATPAEELGAVEKGKSRGRIPTFPPHRWPVAPGEIPKSVYDAPGTMCIPCAGLNTHSCERLEDCFSNLVIAGVRTRH